MSSTPTVEAGKNLVNIVLDYYGKNNDSVDKAAMYEAEIEDDETNFDQLDGDRSNLPSSLGTSATPPILHSEEELEKLSYLAMNSRLAEGTVKNHLSWWSAFLTWCASYNFVVDSNPEAESIDPVIIDYMIRFIAQKCVPVVLGGKGKSYSVAQSIRAAFTYHFHYLTPQDPIRIYVWHKNTQLSTGNPSKAMKVSTFMYGLKKLKAKYGEVSKSKRALASKDIVLLYHHLVGTSPTSPLPPDYAVGVMKYTIFLLCFICCWRIDEALSLEWNQIGYPDQDTVQITLKLRKNHRTGGCQPYILKRNDNIPELCPVRAVFRWHSIQKILREQQGSEPAQPNSPYFCSLNSAGYFLFGRRLESEAVSTWLRDSLKKLGVYAWVVYASHSFRRGGTQYWMDEMGKTINEILAWGGWNQAETGSMFRYLYSASDDKDNSDFTCPLANALRLESLVRKNRLA